MTLAAALARRPLAAWRETLVGFDVALQPLRSIASVRRDMLGKSAARHTVIFRHEAAHPSGRMVQHIEPTAIRPLRAPLIPTPAFEKYGASTDALMSELGFSAAEIAKMRCDNAISNAWIADYLPD